jgi:hypothetical protein
MNHLIKAGRVDVESIHDSLVLVVFRKDARNNADIALPFPRYMQRRHSPGVHFLQSSQHHRCRLWEFGKDAEALIGVHSAYPKKKLFPEDLQDMGLERGLKQGA